MAPPVHGDPLPAVTLVPLAKHADMTTSLANVVAGVVPAETEVVPELFAPATENLSKCHAPVPDISYTDTSRVFAFIEALLRAVIVVTPAIHDRH